MLMLLNSALQPGAVSGQFYELLVRVLGFYALHLIVLVGGYLLLWWQAKRGQTPAPVPWAGGLGLAFVLVFLASEPQGEWFGDFVEAYYQGGASVLQGLDEVPKAFDRGVHGFVNIPILALPFAPFALLPKMASAVVFLVLGIVAVYACFRTLVSELKLDRYGATLVALLFALNGPLLNSLREGNTSHFALWAVTVAFFKLQRGREWTAGVLIGISALFKLPLLLFGVYFVVRGRFRAAAGLALAVGVAGVSSVVLFGVPAHVAWYERFVAPASELPMGAFNVQSIAALILRFERAGEVICSWSGYPSSGLGQLLARLASVGLMLGAALASLLPAWRRGRSVLQSRSLQQLEFLLVFVLACIVSPLAWSHYYCWMLLPLSLLLVSSALRPSPNNAEAVTASSSAPLASMETWVAVAVVLVSAPVLRAWCSPSGLAEVPYLLALSHYLWGGLLTYLLLLLRAYRCGMRAADGSAH